MLFLVLVFQVQHELVEKTIVLILIAEQLGESEIIVPLVLQFVLNAQKVRSHHTTGIIKVFADIVPEVEHYLVGEFFDTDVALDEKLTHLLVFARCGTDDHLIDHLQELNP